MRKEVTKIVDDQEYTFYALPATQSLGALTKIAKLICSTLGASLDNNNDSIESLKALLISNFDYSKALQSFATRLDDEEVLAIALLFFSKTSHKGSGVLNTKESVDVHFGGKVLHMINVFGIALSVEYSDFFAEGQGLESIISRAKGSLTQAP